MPVLLNKYNKTILYSISDFAAAAALVPGAAGDTLPVKVGVPRRVDLCFPFLAKVRGRLVDREVVDSQPMVREERGDASLASAIEKSSMMMHPPTRTRSYRLYKMSIVLSNMSPSMRRTAMLFFSARSCFRSGGSECWKKPL